MAKVIFKNYNQGEISLFPQNIGELIPQDSPVRLLSKIVDSLDISTLIKTYKAGGTTPYNPRMLLKVVFYAYMNNIYSCRKIADIMHWHVHYMWLSGRQYPSWSTINRFRSEHMKDCVNHLFIQVVELLVKLGQVSLDVQYIDGTKIESVANKYTFVWKKSTEKSKSKLEEKINGILSQIDEGIAQDNANGEENGSSTEGIDSTRLQELIDKINSENKELEKGSDSDKAKAKKQEKAVKTLKKHKEKLEEYEKKLSILGDRNSYSKTDTDATFMRMKEDAMNNGQTKPGYNLQIGTENQYITNFAFYWQPNDSTTLTSFLTLDQVRFGKFPKETCADSGYGSEENYDYMEANGITPYVKYNWFHKEQHRPFKQDISRVENLYYNEEDDYFVCPMGQHMEHVGHYKSASQNGYTTWIDTYRAVRCEGCPLRGACFKSKEENRTIRVNHNLRKHKERAFELLTSEEGLRHRSKRPIEPEAVFGQMKFNKKYKRFRHRGLAKVNMDFGIFAMTFNLQKLIRKVANGENLTLLGKIKALCEQIFALLRILECRNNKTDNNVKIFIMNANCNLAAA